MFSMADMFAAMRPTLFANRKESCFPVPSAQCLVLSALGKWDSASSTPRTARSGTASR